MGERVAASRGIFPGWKVVATAFGVAVFAWGFGFYGPSVFLHVLHETRGWSIGLISAAITVQYVLSAGIVAYLSDIHRRVGVAATTRAGAALLAAGTLGWSLSASPWQLFIASLVTGAGWAMTSGAAINAMVAPWFERRRSAALSHALNGASVGGVAMTPLWTLLIGAFGFPIAAALLSAVMLATIWPLAGLYLRSTPAERGLNPDGAVGQGQVSPDVPRAPLSRAALFRLPRFATLCTTFSLALFAQVGLIAHLVSLLAPRLGESGAAAAVSLMTVCAITGRLVLASALGEADRRIATAINLLLQVCGVTLLATGGGSLWSLAGCALFGLAVGNVISLPALILQAELDRADVLRAVALATAVNQALFAFAPGVFGVLRDLTGSYALPLAVAAVLQFAGAIVILAGRPAVSVRRPAAPPGTGS